MILVGHGQVPNYIRRLILFIQNVNVASKHCGLNLHCVENPIDVFYVSKDEDIW